ncbi:InlB B-repeat-containing protein, partial [Methanimicrococcus blatticola]
MEITDLTLKHVSNYWLYNTTTNQYDLYDFNVSYGKAISVYGDNYLHPDYYPPSEINGVPVNGDTSFYIEPDYANPTNYTFNFYYGGPTESGYITTPFSASYVFVNIGDVYEFEKYHTYQMKIKYDLIENPGPYSYLHVIHNYDGIRVSSFYDYDDISDCAEFNSDRISAGNYNLTNKINSTYMNHEYIYDSMTLHYETAETGLGYNFYDSLHTPSYINSRHPETFVIGDVFNASLYANQSYFNETGIPTSDTVHQKFSAEGLELTETSNSDNPFYRLIKDNSWLYFVYSLTSPFIGGPVTYFQNNSVNLENNLAYDADYIYEFEEGLHYVVVINYKYGFPVTHHYMDGLTEEESFTEGKTVTYDVSTDLYDWKRDKTGYELVRIEVIESKSWLNVRDYFQGYFDQFGNPNVISFRNYTVREGVTYPVSNFVLPDYYLDSFSFNDSDTPWEDYDRLSRYEVNSTTMVMESGKNVLNFFYSYGSIAASIQTLVSGNGDNIRTIWDDEAPFTPVNTLGNDLTSSNYIFSEGKMYEVHYYYMKGNPQTYTLTYDANGGTGSVPVDTLGYPYGSYATALFPNDLSKTGYEFICWNDNPDGTGQSYYPGFSSFNQIYMDGDKTVYAIWSGPLDIPLKHVYNFNSGSEIWYDTVEETKSVTTHVNTFLNGWYVPDYNNTNFNIEKIVIEERKGVSITTTVISGYDNIYYNNPFYMFKNGYDYNVTIYYACNTDLYYKVLYYPNEADSGTVPVDSSNPYVYNALVMVLDNQGASGNGVNILEKENYIFAGWNTKADGSGTTYMPGNQFHLIDTIMGDPNDWNWSTIDLYAQWVSLSPTVTFNAMGGTFDDNAIITTTPSGSLTYVRDQTDSSNNELLIVSNVQSNSLITEPTPATAKTDSVIEGWYTTSTYDSGTKWDFSASTVTGDTTLYAKWIPKYTLTYHSNDVSIDPELTETATHAVGSSVTLPDAETDFSWSVTDKHFVGWSETPTGSVISSYTMPSG